MLDYLIVASNKEQKEEITEKLQNFNRKTLNISDNQQSAMPISYNIQKDGQVIAGINAYLYFLQGVLHIDILFVEKEYRFKNLGSELLQKVEKNAKASGAALCHLDTYDFQAKDFYLKNGYEVFGTLEDCPPGHQRYYMKKILRIIFYCLCLYVFPRHTLSLFFLEYIWF